MSNTVGSRIKKIREEKGIIQEDMAAVIGVTQSNYGRLEKDDERISVPRLLLIAKTLEVTVDELLFGEKKEETKFLLTVRNNTIQMQSM